tara:strand:+ start:325 stop:1056 length:732 start_codon:yes stop_codon:yes gene_type:complete
MKIVFLAAGKGTRIFEKIKSPKALIRINKVSLIQRLIKNIEKKFWNNIFIVTGFQSSKIKNETKKFKVNFIENKLYFKTEMLYSMYLALKKINDDIVFSYSDIFYEKKIISSLIKSKSKNIIVPINTNWEKIWKIRKKNIIDDAETLKIKNNKIVEIGKKIKKIKDVQGQYMGIFMIPRNRRKEILKIIKENKMEKNHITYFLNFLIQKNEILKPKLYKGLWYEFDDKTDLNQFKKIIDEKIY